MTSGKNKKRYGSQNLWSAPQLNFVFKFPLIFFACIKNISRVKYDDISMNGWPAWQVHLDMIGKNVKHGNISVYSTQQKNAIFLYGPVENDLE